MNKEQLMVRAFHAKFGLTIKDKPTVPEYKDEILRNNLIEEEADEFVSWDRFNLLEKLDALCDLLYVTYGAGITYGFDLEKAFKEVHRSNMSKLWTSQEVHKLDLNTHDKIIVDPLATRLYLVKRKVDGKVIKSPSYNPANLEQFLK